MTSGVCSLFSLRQVKIEQRKLNDNSNSLVDMAKVRRLDYRRPNNCRYSVTNLYPSSDQSINRAKFEKAPRTRHRQMSLTIK